MGGKRPDQYQIDPAEAGATDYKNLPQTGRGHSNLDDTIELDRQKVARSDAEQEVASHDTKAPMPAKDPPPSRDANRGLEARAEGHSAGSAAGADDHSEEEQPG